MVQQYVQHCESDSVFKSKCENYPLITLRFSQLIIWHLRIFPYILDSTSRGPLIMSSCLYIISKRYVTAFLSRPQRALWLCHHLSTSSVNVTSQHSMNGHNEIWLIEHNVTIIFSSHSYLSSLSHQSKIVDYNTYSQKAPEFIVYILKNSTVSEAVVRSERWRAALF